MYSSTNNHEIVSLRKEVAHLREERDKLRKERDKLRKEVTKLQNKVDDRDIIILMMYSELDETAKDLEILGRVTMCLNVMLAVKTDGKGYRPPRK